MRVPAAIFSPVGHADGIPLPGSGIDLLSYIKTRRFVFPQIGVQKREKLPQSGQLFPSFFIKGTG